MEEHRLDHLFGYGFHDRYTEYLKSIPLGSSVEWHGRLTCMRCGALVSLPVTHKDYHKQRGEV